MSDKKEERSILQILKWLDRQMAAKGHGPMGQLNLYRTEGGWQVSVSANSTSVTIHAKDRARTLEKFVELLT